MDETFSDLPAATKVEVAVIRSLTLLARGGAGDFCRNSDPPQEIASWLTQAEMEPIRGLLMSTLHRWHELQQQQSQP